MAKLTESERWALINALRVAIVEYQKDAERFAKHDRLSAQFKQQIREAQMLSDRIEQADEIRLVLEE